MIRRLAVFISPGHDPHYNLALEQCLLESVTDQCILYLWQNENTVVIGRNQNPWKECACALLLQEEGGHLARRLSGGGAVFHDLGNLNFTFLMPQEDFDTGRQLAVIGEAMESLGIPTEISGRNDILSLGRKFSGNAFYKNGKQAYHHGTLLVDADMAKMTRYLNPSKAKLHSKGVDSVRSRVVNLKEMKQDLTVQTLQTALIRAFAQVYGMEPEMLREEAVDGEKLTAYTLRNRSWEWNFGQKMPFTLACEQRFGWGEVQLQLRVEKGVIQHIRAYSDAMDWEFIPKLEEALSGCRLQRSEILARLEENPIPMQEDILNLLCSL